MKILSITTGDADGIGFEVTDKALAKLGPKTSHQILVWRSANSSQKFSSTTQKKFKIVKVASLKDALEVTPQPKQLIEISSNQNPADWVRQSAQACLSGHIDGICTGPLSKTSPGAQGGHTGIFRELVKDPLYMFFLGEKFNVLLLTDHVPLSDFTLKLTPERIGTSIVLCQEFIDKHFPKLSRRPVGVLGINPHAGEAGLLGTDETKLLSPILSSLGKKYRIEGPLIPDAAFLPTNWKKYSAYIACYHDQALIPFKMIHGHDGGVHLTLGLPFVRTSVDHGTAKEIFGKNKANPGSMIDALKWAIKLTAAPIKKAKRN